MKGSVLEWITPEGQAIIPPIHPRSKHDRGFHHEQTGALLCPAGVDWGIPQYVNSHHVVFIQLLINDKYKHQGKTEER